MTENTSSTSGGGSGAYRPDLQDKAQAAPTETILAPITVPEQGGFISATAVPVAVEPTQVRRPWRATARTAFAAFIALAGLTPLIAAAIEEATGYDLDGVPFVAVVLATAAAVTRVMALAQVEVFLRTFLPFLSAAPKEK